MIFILLKNAHLMSRLKQSQKEAQDWKKSFEEEHNKNEMHLSKFTMYDETLRNLKDQLNESQNLVSFLEILKF